MSRCPRIADWEEKLAYELNHWRILFQGFDPVDHLSVCHRTFSETCHIFQNRDGKFYFIADEGPTANDATSKVFLTRQDASYELKKFSHSKPHNEHKPRSV